MRLQSFNQLLPILLVEAFLVSGAQGFFPSSPSCQAAHFLAPLRMGLYDTPLSPRPPPRKDEDDDDDDNDNDNNNKRDEQLPDTTSRDELQITKTLFEFDESGNEVNGRLPSLKRRLDRGIGCYFEPTDRLVLNLVEKSACAVEDACWALEACEGDLTEAWTRISVARRILLNKDREESGDWDGIDIEKEFLKRKAAREDAKMKDRAGGFLGGGIADADWLPRKNPKPVDDEPWFTG